MTYSERELQRRRRDQKLARAAGAAGYAILAACALTIAFLVYVYITSYA